jgi:ADP-heptose:LPS heptosyltransferase
MPILDQFNEARFRQRSLSRFDSRFREFIRRIERKIKFLLSSPLGVLLHPKRAKTPLSLSNVSSILILRYDALGDAVLTTPLWRSLKRLAPQIRIGVAGSARNRTLLEGDPDIDEIFIFSKMPSVQLFRELLRARKRKWNLVLNLYFHDKTRGAVFAKIAAPNGISVTIVREKKEKYLQMYSVVGNRPPIPTPMVQQNLVALKEALDLPIDIQLERPSLPEFPEIDKAFNSELDVILQKFGKIGYLIINTDASQLYKEWGVEHSIALARRVVQAYPELHVFLSSAPARAENIRKHLGARKGGISYLETPSILHLAVAVRHAIAVVSPDTSVIHFATAQRVPVIGLYLEPNEFLPYKSPSRVLFAPDGKMADGILLDDVFDALQDLLAETSPDKQAFNNTIYTTETPAREQSSS